MGAIGDASTNDDERDATRHASLEKVKRGLMNMGFREADVRRAIEQLAHEDVGGESPPPETLIRQALALLC